MCHSSISPIKHWHLAYQKRKRINWFQSLALQIRWAGYFWVTSLISDFWIDSGCTVLLLSFAALVSEPKFLNFLQVFLLLDNRINQWNDLLSATAFSFLCSDYISLMIYAMVFGFTCASLMTLNSVILADFHGLERIESAFGMSLFFRGIATFISGPIVGHLHDTTHSYTPGFLFGGIMLISSGAILFAMPPLQRWVIRRKTQHKNGHIESSGAS